MDGHFFYLIPLTAALANISLLAYFFAGKGDFEHIMRGLLTALVLTNLALVLVVLAPDQQAARFRLHLLRHPLVCVPFLLLLLSNYISGRHVFNAPALIAAILTAAFLIAIQFTYFTDSTFLVRELKKHTWGYFPALNMGGRAALGGLFVFSFLNSMYVLLRAAPSPMGDAHRPFAFLIFIWWLGFFLNIPALLGLDVYPLGNALDAVLCIAAAAVLHKRRPARGPGFLLMVSELTASLGFGLIMGGLLLLFFGDLMGGLMAPAMSVISMAAALIFLQSIKARAGVSPAPVPMSEIPQGDSPFARLGLSNQETRICELIHAGYTRKQIAFFLSITDGTLRNHLAAVYARVLPKSEGSRDQFQRLTLLLNRIASGESVHR